MKEIEAIYELIKSLTSPEWVALEKYLTGFSSNNKAKETIWKLAQLIQCSNKPDETIIAYSRKLYGTVNDEAVERLARNLKYKIFDCLVLTSHSFSAEKNTEFDEIITDREVGVTKLKKKCLQYHYLSQNKKDLDVTRNLLNEIIKIAKEYEAYPELVQHLKLKNWAYNLREGTKKFDALSAEIEKYERMNQAYAASYNYIAKLYMLTEFSGKPDKEEIITLLRRAIPDVKRKYISTNSTIILYYFKLLNVAYKMVSEDYAGARRMCHEIINLLKTNKSIFTKRRLGTAYDNLSTCSMHLGMFDEAVEYTRNALPFIQKDSFNYALSKQWEFYALFHNKMYNEATECAKAMLSTVSKKDLGDFRHEKFNFLLACSYFKQEMFTDANTILKEKFHIKEDKEGWEFNWRVLSIMTNIELGLEGKAEAQVEQLRKFIFNNSTANTFSPRQEGIEKFLTLAMRKGFMFSQLNGKSANCLNLLSSQTDEYKWQLRSAELIQFHAWATVKMKAKTTILR